MDVRAAGDANSGGQLFEVRVSPAILVFQHPSRCQAHGKVTRMMHQDWHRHSLWYAAVAALLLASMTGVTAHGKQSSHNDRRRQTVWKPPSTPWGDPDLEGVYTNTDELSVPMERPDAFVGRTLADVNADELAEFTRQSNEARRQQFEQSNAFRGLTAVDRFDLRPSRRWLVVNPADGKIPPLTTEGQRRQAASMARLNQPPDSPEALNLWHRCISLGVPGSMMPTPDGAPFRIVQAAGIVAIQYERLHETRIIHVDGRQPPPDSTIRQYMGVSRGHWESGSLTIESTAFKGVYQMTSPASSGLRVVERFTPVAARELEWSVTIDDPAGWTRPWTFAMRLTETKDQMFEDACHEGNYVIENVLKAARAEERGR
jgi:hypothetical protein